MLPKNGSWFERRGDSSEPHASIPEPGDLILVDRSEWYALKDGQRLRVCEVPGWITDGSAIYVAPRHQVRTFWGPNYGQPDDSKPMEMSTSGGPFKTIAKSDLQGLNAESRVSDQFWHWHDWPRAGGGVDYECEVTLWRLPRLIDRHFRQMERYRKETNHE